MRKQREWYPGATYHLMERGIRRMEIFKDEMDYESFLIILRRLTEKYAMTLHAYCLMTNHVHLLLESSDQEISGFMQRMAGDYARTYNRRHGYRGHLFENRYKGCLVRDDSYFLQTSRYIHLNPVKAGIVQHAEEYPWSSYRCMLGFRDDGMTERERTLSFFKGHSICLYRQFVEDSGHRYEAAENRIRRSMGEDALWLPW